MGSSKATLHFQQHFFSESHFCFSFLILFLRHFGFNISQGILRQLKSAWSFMILSSIFL